MALRGLFQEAIAKDDDALKKVLKEYETILVNDPANMVSFPEAQCWCFADFLSLSPNVESRSSGP
jgi:hypothetical protein